VDREDLPELERITRLAAELAATDPGPGGALATELAEALASLSARVDALWQLISAVVASAGAVDPVETSDPGTRAPGPPGRTGPAAGADFARAVASARRTGQRDLRLSIDGREWVAALSPETPSRQAPGQQAAARQRPDADQAAWSAIERLARESKGQDDGPARPDQDDR
jgi:hypothetical protein